MIDTREYISNLGMPEKVSLFKELYNELAGQGIEGDTELAHVNTFEASLLKSLGGSGTLNEITNLREYKGGGGAPPPPPTTQTVTQTSEFPTELKPFISDVLGEAKAEFGREKAEGYLPFQGPQLAAFTPEQEAAFATGREQFGLQGLAGTPLGAARTYYEPALAATALGTAEIGAEDIGRRMDPFLQNVVSIAQREAIRNEEAARQQRAARAVAGQGFLGGTRPAFVESQAAESLQERLSDIQAQGLSSAFQNAQRAAEAQRAREMAGGRQFAGLGESAFQRARGDITGLSGIGEAQQLRSQQALDIARREFEEEKAFPQTALQRYGSIIRGFPLTPSQQQVYTAPAPIPPSLTQTLLGGVGTGVGLYGAFGGFKKAGGLVGLLGGGTPTTPLRPPHSLFSGPSSRVGAPQYQGGGPVGVNLGGGFASGAGGGPSTPFNVSTTAPSAMDLNKIIEELRRRKLLGRSAGGLTGLTVSRNARRPRISTTIPSLSRLLSPEVMEGREEFDITPTSPSGAITAQDKAALDEEARQRIQTTIEAQEPWDVSGLSNRILQGLTVKANIETDPFIDPGPGGAGFIDVAPEDIQAALQANLLAGDEPSYDPVPEIVPETVDTIPIDTKNGTENGYERQPLIPEVPEDYDTSAWETAQTDYLTALKAATEGGDQDKWLALADLSRRTMAATPQYEGESIVNIAARTGEKPLAALQQSMKEDKALRLEYLKANVDVEAQRAQAKLAEAEKKFDNALRRFMAGIALTESEYKILGILHPKSTAVTLTETEKTDFPKFVEPFVNTILDPQSIKKYADVFAKNKIIEGDPVEALRSGIKIITTKGTSGNLRLMQRVEEIMGTQRQKDKDAAVEQALSEWIQEGGTFKKAPLFGLPEWMGGYGTGRGRLWGGQSFGTLNP